MLFACGGGHHSPFRDIAENLQALFTEAYYWEDDSAWAAREYQQSRYDSVDSRGDIIYSSDEDDDEGTCGTLRTYSDDLSIKDEESSLAEYEYLATIEWRPSRDCKEFRSSSPLPIARRGEAGRRSNAFTPRSKSRPRGAQTKPLEALPISSESSRSRQGGGQQMCEASQLKPFRKRKSTAQLPVSSEPIPPQAVKQQKSDTNEPKRPRIAQAKPATQEPVSSEPMSHQGGTQQRGETNEPKALVKAETKIVARLPVCSELKSPQKTLQRGDTNKPNGQAILPFSSTVINFRAPQSLLALSRIPIPRQGGKQQRGTTLKAIPLIDKGTETSSSAIVSYRAPQSLLALSRDPIQASAIALMALMGYNPSYASSRKTDVPKGKAPERMQSPAPQFFKPRDIVAFATVLRIMAPKPGPAHTGSDTVVGKVSKWALSSRLLRSTYHVPKLILPILGAPGNCMDQSQQRDHSSEASHSIPSSLVQDIDSMIHKGRE